MHRAQLLFLLLGVGLFVFVVQKAGISQIAARPSCGGLVVRGDLRPRAGHRPSAQRGLALVPPRRGELGFPDRHAARAHRRRGGQRAHADRHRGWRSDQRDAASPLGAARRRLCLGDDRQAHLRGRSGHLPLHRRRRGAHWSVVRSRGAHPHARGAGAVDPRRTRLLRLAARRHPARRPRRGAHHFRWRRPARTVAGRCASCSTRGWPRFSPRAPAS